MLWVYFTMFVCPSTCQKDKGIFLQSSQENLAELLEVKLMKVVVVVGSP